MKKIDCKSNLTLFHIWHWIFILATDHQNRREDKFMHIFKLCLDYKNALDFKNTWARNFMAFFTKVQFSSKFCNSFKKSMFFYFFQPRNGLIFIDTNPYFDNGNSTILKMLYQKDKKTKINSQYRNFCFSAINKNWPWSSPQ